MRQMGIGSNHFKSAVAAGLMLAAATVHAGGIEPLVEHFDTDPETNINYMVQHQPSVDLQHKPSKGLWIGKGLDAPGNFSLAAEISNSGVTGNGFKAHLSVAKYTSPQNQVRLAVLARKSALSASGYAGYLKTAKDGIQIMKDGKKVVGEAWNGSPRGNFDLTLTGTYTASGALELELTVTNGSNTQTLNYVDPKPAQSGAFGIIGRVMKGKSVEFDQWTIEAL